MFSIIRTPIHKMKTITITPAIRKYESGQSLVELSLILLLLMLLLSGVFDLGRAIFQRFAMQDAAEEGIIYGTSFPTDCNGIRTRIDNNLSNRSLNGGMTILVEIEGDGGVYQTCESIPFAQVYAGRELRITVTKDFDVTMPFIGTFIGQTISLEGNANGIILRPQPPET